MSDPDISPEVTSREAIKEVLEAHGPLSSAQIVSKVTQIDGVSASNTSIRLKLSEMHKHNEVRSIAGTKRTGYVYKLPEDNNEI